MLQNVAKARGAARIGWYYKRLRVMQPAEIGHRLREQASLAWLWGRYLTNLHRPAADSPPQAFAFCRASAPQLPGLAFDHGCLRASADTLLAARLESYGEPWQWRPEGSVWHRAAGGRSWPRRFFWAIPYRDGNPYGDARKAWEPSRLQQLIELAVLAEEGPPHRRQQAIDLLVRQLRSWVAANPPLVGIHYVSAMECALRLIAVCHALDRVRSQLDETPWQDLLSIVRSHAPLILRRLSLHSSAGNHTVAEAAGLVYAGVLFPELAGAERWRARGLELLGQEAQRQVLEDGGGLEQAFGYHKFNVELFWLVQQLLEHRQLDVPQQLQTAVSRGCRFLAACRQEAGLPQIGDSDGGHALSRFLCLPEPSASADSASFPSSGYTVATCGRRPQTRLLLDHGPFGMAPGYGHAHADALSLLLWVGGEEVFVDTGTYTYTEDARWRGYFRGTRAHNTLQVDEQDQAQQEACFLWSKPARARLLEAALDSPGGGRLLACHDGYQRLDVSHRRGVAWQDERWLLIWDSAQGPGPHRLQLHWHLPQQPRQLGPDRLLLTAGGHELLVITRGGRLELARGREDPILGWRSRHYGIKEPLTTLRISHSGPLPHEFVTLVLFDPAAEADPALEEALSWMRNWK